jgi:ribose-phosphate pyrophosphokinase
MKPSLVIWPGNETMGTLLVDDFNYTQIKVNIRKFPDGESYVRLLSPVDCTPVAILHSLKNPNPEIIPLLFLAKKLKDAGASWLTLVTPYLPYMRQDMEFNPGEAVTSRYFSELISAYFDQLITVDCHLHRTRSLSKLYTIPTQNISSTSLLADWIAMQVRQPLLIGPDSESKQWVQLVAKQAKAPYVVFSKYRQTDQTVTLELPDLSLYTDHQPVLIDDIISTAGTMCEAIKLLKFKMKRKPICIGIHGVFSQGAYVLLKRTGASKIVTTNSIPHPSNKIDVTPLLAAGIEKFVV